MRPAFTAFFATLALAACGGEGLDPDASNGSSGFDGKADGVGVDAPPLPTLADHYALTIESTVVMKERGEEETTSAVTKVAALVNVLGSEDPTEPQTLEFLLCGVDLPEIAGRKPEVDSAALRRAAPAHARVALKHGAIDEEGVRGLPELVSEQTAVLLGVDAAEPLTEELPDDDDDPRVVDLDEDGKPGLSIQVSGFRIYAGIRARFGLAGSVGEDGVVTGDAGLVLDLAVFGDSIPFVNAAKKLRETEESTDVLSEDHAFVLTPIEVSETDSVPTCEAVEL